MSFLKPFIKNHQYNWIKKQVDQIQQAIGTSNSQVLEATKYETYLKLMEKFPDASEKERNVLENMVSLKSEVECQEFIQRLEPLVEAFPPVTKQTLKSLFSKTKNLKVPDLDTYDFRYMTYLSWSDPGTNQFFIVYPLNGQLVGIKGKYTLVHKKNICFACNKHEEVALFSGIANTKKHQIHSDHYQAFGNYLCINNEVCNKNITDITSLESFIEKVLGNV